MNKQRVCIVWFKRDLRLEDNSALAAAAASKVPVLPLYLYEPSIMQDKHYSERHWRFVWQSLLDLHKRLKQFGGLLHVSYADALPFFCALVEYFNVEAVYSHQEIGVASTYHRDKQISALLKQHGIPWLQYQTGAVQRGRSDRESWSEDWHRYMQDNLAQVELSQVQWCTDNSPVTPLPTTLSKSLHTPDPAMQLGGEKHALVTLHSFLATRHTHYHHHISSPQLSQKSCSRLSPYIAWGNISIRQVYQYTTNHPDFHTSKGFQAFVSRLHWHCHFIQKFESQCEMEFSPLNSGYSEFPYLSDSTVQSKVSAWQEGCTGVPIIDACMRCLHATGYINFRMRALLVSYLCHTLFIDWRKATHHLAQLFLDFEPGIHYPQIQMQAGVTGINTLRIYNPIKQGLEKDKDAEFIHTWLPELAHIPAPDAHHPWTISLFTQQLFNTPVPTTYQAPLLPDKKTLSQQRDVLWQWKNRPDVCQQSATILKRHTLKNRTP